MRVFLKKPKWLAYLLLLIIMLQAIPPVVRYYWGSSQWATYESGEYDFAIDYPGNWTVESYRGWFRGREGVVAIIGDSPGVVEAHTLLTIYWRLAPQPSLSRAADWGHQIVSEDGGYSYSPLEQFNIGAKSLPALGQRLRYDEDQVGLSIYTIGSEAEYVLVFRSEDGNVDSAELIEYMVSSFELSD